jgi:hypothetical protein
VSFPALRASKIFPWKKPTLNQSSLVLLQKLRQRNRAQGGRRIINKRKVCIDRDLGRCIISKIHSVGQKYFQNTLVNQRIQLLSPQNLSNFSFCKDHTKNLDGINAYQQVMYMPYLQSASSTNN